MFWNRSLITTTLAAAFATTLMLMSPAWAQKTLVIAGWGGPAEKELRKKFIPEFEKKNNAKVEWIAASSFLNLGRLQSQKANPQIDVVLMDDIVLHQAVRENLLAPLDPKIVTHLQDVPKNAQVPGGFGVNIGWNVTSLYYNTKIFAEKGLQPITAWADLFDPKLCNRVVIRNITSAYGLYPLLMLGRAAGSDEKNIDVAFAQMKKLAPCIIEFPMANSEVEQMTLRGDAWVGVTGMSEMQFLLDRGAPLKFIIPREGTIAMGSMAAVVKGAPNGALAQQFVNDLISPQGQHDMAIALSFFPTNTKVKVDDEIRKRLPLDIGQNLNLVTIDFDVVMSNRPAWTERFAKEVVAR